jgi:hypothetical protein
MQIPIFRRGWPQVVVSELTFCRIYYIVNSFGHLSRATIKVLKFHLIWRRKADLSKLSEYIRAQHNIN